VLSSKPDAKAEIIYGTGETEGTKPPSGDYDHWYLLPLKTVEEYHFRFPEKAPEMMKYIETHEN
jgi:hypothetical protein